MYEAYYKDTNWSSSIAFFDVDFEHDLVCLDIFRNNQLEEFSKTTMKRLRNFQENLCRTAVFIIKTWNVIKRDSQRSYTSEVAVHRRFQNKRL